MTNNEYIEKYAPTLEHYWNDVSSQLLQWKLSYQWPQNVHLQEAILLRNQLEVEINNDLNFHGYFSKAAQK